MYYYHVLLHCNTILRWSILYPALYHIILHNKNVCRAQHKCLVQDVFMNCMCFIWTNISLCFDAFMVTRNNVFWSSCEWDVNAKDEERGIGFASQTWDTVMNPLFLTWPRNWIISCVPLKKRVLVIKNPSWGCIPSGNLLHSYRKSPFSLGKSTINGDFP